MTDQSPSDSGDQWEQAWSAPGQSPPPQPGASPPASGAYPTTPYGTPPYDAPPRNNGLAVASLVCGICSLVVCPVIGVPGLVTGMMARRQIRESQGTQTGDGLAIGGIVTSIIGLVVVGIIVLIVLVAILGTSTSSQFSRVGSVVR